MASSAIIKLRFLGIHGLGHATPEGRTSEPIACLTVVSILYAPCKHFI